MAKTPHNTQSFYSHTPFHRTDIDPTMSRRSARNVPSALGNGNLENLTDLKKRKVPAEEVNDVSR